MAWKGFLSGVIGIPGWRSVTLVNPQNRERNVVQRPRGGIQTCSVIALHYPKEEKHFIVENDRFNTTIPDPVYIFL